MFGTEPSRQPALAVGAAVAVNLGYAAAITALALTPSPPPIGSSDWLLHGVAFGVQTALLCGLFRHRLRPIRAIVTAAFTALLYGGMIEVLQLLVPGRYFQVSDLMANAGGVLLAGVLLATLFGLRQRALDGGAPR